MFFGKGYNSVDIRTTVRDVIQNITPSDVLYGYVPLVLTFKPYFTANLGDRTKSVNSLDFLGINNIFHTSDSCAKIVSIK